MTKKMIISAVLFFCIGLLRAQTDSKSTYSVGTNIVSAGIGLGSSIAGYTYGSQSPAISLQYERGVADAGPGVIGIGGYLGFKTYKYSSSAYSYKWQYTIIGIRGLYHLTSIKVDNLDVYGGIMVSYNNLHFSDTDTNSGANYGSAAGFSIFAGGRYYFTDKIGAFVELGYGVAYINLGLSVKF